MPFWRFQKCEDPGTKVVRGELVKTACRKCRSCRSNDRREADTRIMAEVMGAPRVWFLTLTFRTSALPDEGDGFPLCQRWTNKLRERWRRAGRIGPGDVRYALAREYGSKKGRLHYHALLCVPEGIVKRDLEGTWVHGFMDIVQVRRPWEMAANDAWRPVDETLVDFGRMEKKRKQVSGAKGAVSYLSAYMTKDARESQGDGKRSRRWSDGFGVVGMQRFHAKLVSHPVLQAVFAAFPRSVITGVTIPHGALVGAYDAIASEGGTAKPRDEVYRDHWKNSRELQLPRDEATAFAALGLPHARYRLRCAADDVAQAAAWDARELPGLVFPAAPARVEWKDPVRRQKAKMRALIAARDAAAAAPQVAEPTWSEDEALEPWPVQHCDAAGRVRWIQSGYRPRLRTDFERTNYVPVHFALWGCEVRVEVECGCFDRDCLWQMEGRDLVAALRVLCDARSFSGRKSA